MATQNEVLNGWRVNVDTNTYYNVGGYRSRSQAIRYNMYLVIIDCIWYVR